MTQRNENVTYGFEHHKHQMDAAIHDRQRAANQYNVLSRVMPLATTSSVFTASFFLNVWEYLPEQARPAGLAVFTAACAASPFVKLKSSFPYVALRNDPFWTSESEAMKELDSEVGTENDRPLQNFYDRPQNSTNPNQTALIDASKARISEKWSEDIQETLETLNQQKYYGSSVWRTASHATIFALTLYSAVQHSDNLHKNWETAMNWTPPLPPLEYNMDITPPDYVRGVRVLTNQIIQDATAQDADLTPHDKSILRITTYNRPVDISINGELSSDSLVQNGDNNTRNNSEHVYEIVLTPDIVDVKFEDIDLDFNIVPDLAPNLVIKSVKPDARNPENLRLEYEIRDDIGAETTQGKIGVSDENGEIQTPIFEMNQFPELILPNN